MFIFSSAAVGLYISKHCIELVQQRTGPQRCGKPENGDDEMQCVQSTGNPVLRTLQGMGYLSSRCYWLDWKWQLRIWERCTEFSSVTSGFIYIRIFVHVQDSLLK